MGVTSALIGEIVLLCVRVVILQIVNAFHTIVELLWDYYSIVLILEVH